MHMTTSSRMGTTGRSRRLATAMLALALLLGTWPGGLGAVAADAPACGTPDTTIPEIQGDGVASGQEGAHVSVSGVVTAIFRNAGGPTGFFLQDPLGDGNPQTSD